MLAVSLFAILIKKKSQENKEKKENEIKAKQENKTPSNIAQTKKYTTENIKKFLDFDEIKDNMIIQKDGIECKCGNKGCFEKYASMKAFKQGIIKLLNLNEEIDSREILELLKEKIRQNNIEVKEYIDNYIDNVLYILSAHLSYNW